MLARPLTKQEVTDQQDGKLTMIETAASRSYEIAKRMQESSDYDTESIVMFGSAVTEGLWVDGRSDIDLNVFVSDEWGDKIPELAGTIERTIDSKTGITWHEHPRVVVDDLQPRVEAVVSLDSQVFDISWATRAIQLNRFESKVRRDNLEIYLGQIYHYGIELVGKRPDCHPLTKVSPFIENQDVIDDRLAVVSEVFDETCDKLLWEIDQNALDVGTLIWALGSLQRYLLQSASLKTHRYPLSYKKHLRYQLDQFDLRCPEELSAQALKSVLRDWKNSVQDL